MKAARGKVMFGLSSVDRRWWRIISSAEAEVLVFSPYLTPKTAFAVASVPRGVPCSVHTVFDVHNFLTGATSVRALRHLIDHGIDLFHIPRLHAKLVIVSGACATIGSQNLTSRGVRNLEANVALSDPKDVAALTEMVTPWFSKRMRITRPMLEALENELPGLVRTQRKLQRAGETLQSRVIEEEEARIRDRRRKEELREAARQERARLVNRIRRKAARLEKSVPLDEARVFVKKSAWWLTHSSGRPIRAPGDARRIEGPSHDLRIRLSDHPFLVTRAIKRCARVVRLAVAEIEGGGSIDREDLEQQLWSAVRSAVATPYGDEHSLLYPLRGTDMVFGAHSIDVEDFANTAMVRTGLTGSGLLRGG